MTLTLTNGTKCTNDVFGDPDYGDVKSCWYSRVQSAASTTNQWISCANENQLCSFSGTRTVRFGSGGRYFTGTYTGQVECVDYIFGDPDYGVVKACSYASTNLASVTTTPTTPVTTTATAPATPTTPVATTTATVTTTSTTAVATTSPTPVAATTTTPAAATTPAPVTTTATAPTPVVSTTVTAAVVLSSSPGASGQNPPIIFNASVTAGAGDVVSLQGSNFGSSPTIYFDGAPSAPLQIVNSVGTSWLAVQIPTTAQGALILRVVNGTGTSAQVKLNAALPVHLDTMQLQPAGAFRVFGRNLLAAGSTPSVTVNGLAATLNLVHRNAHMLVATAPASQQPSAATVLVDNGNGSGAAQLDRTIAVQNAGTGDPFALGVGWASAFSGIAATTVNAATDSRLSQKMVCDGTTDDTPRCKVPSIWRPQGGGVVQLMARRCRLAGTLTLGTGVVLQGAGMTQTTLVYESNYAFWATNVDLAGVRNLTLVSSGSAMEAPLMKNSTRVFLQNVSIQIGTSRQMYLSGNTNFVVANSTFVQTGSISYQAPYTFTGCAGMVFTGKHHPVDERRTHLRAGA